MSEVKTNKLTGTTSAGDIDVTSEGGAVTFQLQQGLAKSWAFYQSQALTDSLNVSSVTDVLTGALYINFANAFSNDDWAGHHTTDNRMPYLQDTRSTVLAYVINRNSSNSLLDANMGNATFHGDLA